MDYTKIVVPLINTNEPEAKLIDIRVKPGQLIEKGDVLFSLETTKATVEVEAPISGYVHLRAVQGNFYSVGDLLAILSKNPTDEIENNIEPTKNENQTQIRITRPARLLAEKLGVDLNELPKDQIITESMIRDLPLPGSAEIPVSILIHPEKSILIYGAGGHAKSLIELVKAKGLFEIIGIMDDKIPVGTLVLGLGVLGTRAILDGLRERGLRYAINGVGGISDFSSRINIFELLEKHFFSLPEVIHPRAWVEESARVGKGVQIFANAYVGSESILQPYCMVNTNAVVSHNCIIGEFSHIAPGALLAGHVEVGEKSLVGMGVKTAIGVKIGNFARIGNGAIINADVPDRTLVAAGRVWSG